MRTCPNCWLNTFEYQGFEIWECKKCKLVKTNKEIFESEVKKKNLQKGRVPKFLCLLERKD